MSKIAGRTGIITFGGLSGINNYTLNESGDPVETTVMGAATKTFLPGTRSYILDCEAVSSTPAMADTFAAAAGMKSFEITGECEALEVSALGDVDTDDIAFRTFLAGLNEWSASLEIDLESGTQPPRASSLYSFGGTDNAIVESCDFKCEVNGICSYTLGLKGKGTLPTEIATLPGSSSAWEASTGAGYLASGTVIVTSYKISGSIGELIRYALSGQGTGELITTDPTP